jgi:ABC-type glycerol-3-phosphate transport system substrate-binding protein
MSSLATTLVLEDGTRAQGFALGELLPLFSEVWKLEASGGEAARPNKVAWSDEDLAERLFSIYLVQTAPAARARGVASWDLVVGRERFAGVRDLTLRGELLDEDDLEVWLSWEGVKELKAEIARFAEAHGKRIRATEVPNTQTKLLTVARAGGRLPDLAMIQSDYVPELVGGRLLQAVDYFRDSGLEAKGYEAFSAAGHAWALPFYFDTQLVFYNRALVGSPPAADWTLDDLVARARSLKGRVRAPLAWNLWSAYWLLPFMAGYGKASIVDADGGMTVDDAPTRQALSTLKALMEEGLLVPAERDAMMSWFASGQAGFILAGSYSIPEFSGLGLDFAVAPYPLATRGGRPIAPLLDFKGLALSRRTEKPVLARRLCQALVSQAFQRRFTSALGKLPASLAAREASRGENPWFSPLSRSAERGIVIPPAGAYPAFKNTMWKLLRFFFTGQMGVDETLSTAQTLIDQALRGK